MNGGDLESSVAACREESVARSTDLQTVDETIASDEVAGHTTAFGALSSETRYRIVRYLIGMDDELCVCELSPMLAVSESAVSHALAVLVDAGLVERRKDGRWRYYRATDQARSLIDAVGESREVVEA